MYIYITSRIPARNWWPVSDIPSPILFVSPDYNSYVRFWKIKLFWRTCWFTDSYGIDNYIWKGILKFILFNQFSRYQNLLVKLSIRLARFWFEIIEISIMRSPELAVLNFVLFQFYRIWAIVIFGKCQGPNLDWKYFGDRQEGQILPEYLGRFLIRRFCSRTYHHIVIIEVATSPAHTIYHTIFSIMTEICFQTEYYENILQWLNLGVGMIDDFDYQNFGLRVVTGYHWLPNLTI